MKQKGTKETSCYVGDHITLQFGLSMGKNSPMYCRAKQKQGRKTAG